MPEGTSDTTVGVGGFNPGGEMGAEAIPGWGSGWPSHSPGGGAEGRTDGMGVVGRGWLAAEAIHMEIHTTPSPASPAWGDDGMGWDMKANVTPGTRPTREPFFLYMYIYREREREREYIYALPHT